MQTILLPFLLMALMQSIQDPSRIADIVFINGKIWTVDESNPEAQAVAVADGKILFVGSNERAKGFVGPQTEIVDLKGRLMLPGFIDNHTHFISGGFQLQSVDLRYAKDEKEFASIIK